MKSLCLSVLIAVIIFPQAFAESVAKPTDARNDVCLSYWFLTGINDPVEPEFVQQSTDEIGEFGHFHYISDDGEVVNGAVAYPKGAAKYKKIAFALHPMGADQSVWWQDRKRLALNKLTIALRHQGFTVITLDARKHGQRGDEGFGPKELLENAHSATPRLYVETIAGSVRDYRLILNWVIDRHRPDEITLLGYSMGAQMGLLLASYESSINRVFAMVPPFVGSDTSPVAPRNHVHRITDADVYWYAGSQDPHSSKQQTQQTFDRIGAKKTTLLWYQAGHLLPEEAISHAVQVIEASAKGGER